MEIPAVALFSFLFACAATAVASTGFAARIAVRATDTFFAAFLGLYYVSHGSSDNEHDDPYYTIIG